jgi:hypothetical protein
MRMWNLQASETPKEEEEEMDGVCYAVTREYRAFCNSNTDFSQGRNAENIEKYKNSIIKWVVRRKCFYKDKDVLMTVLHIMKVYGRNGSKAPCMCN